MVGRGDNKLLSMSLIDLKIYPACMYIPLGKYIFISRNGEKKIRNGFRS